MDVAGSEGLESGLDMNKLLLGIVVGKGAHGVVKRAERRREDGALQVVAVKIVKPPKKQTGVQKAGVPQSAVREISLLRELHHPHIVNLLEVIVSPEKQKVRLVLEWAEYDLLGVLHKHHCDPQQRGLPLAMVRAIMYQLLDATEYVHSQWIMHRDIKPANVLISSDGRIKLADFGLARIYQAPPRPLIEDQVVVTLWYRAPELILGSQHYTPAVDVWSLGALFGELILLKPVFPGEKEESDGMAKDQLLKIFHRLGKPDTVMWPTLVEMPLWDQVSSWSTELTACPSHADGIRSLRDLLCGKMMVATVRKVSPAECNTAVNSMLAMLTFDPNQRITCKLAKELPFFAANPKNQLHGNVFAELGPNWQSFYIGNTQRGNNAQRTI